MGPELALADFVVPALLSGGGTLLQMKAQRQQAADKRDVLNRQLERDDQTNKKNSQMVLNEGDQYSPQKRVDAIQQQENQTYDGSIKDLQTGAGGAGIGAVQTTGDAGNVSDDFVKAKAERAVTEGSRLTSLARELAKTRAPGQVLMGESQRRAELAGNLQDLNSTNQNMARANSNDAESVQLPGYGALGSIASGIGTSMAAGKLAKGLPSLKYAGGSSLPTAANYVNSSDSGIRW